MTQLPETPAPVGPKVRHRAVLKNLPVGYSWRELKVRDRLGLGLGLGVSWRELKVRDRVRVRVRSQLA